MVFLDAVDMQDDTPKKRWLLMKISLVMAFIALVRVGREQGRPVQLEITDMLSPLKSLETSNKTAYAIAIILHIGPTENLIETEHFLARKKGYCQVEPKPLKYIFLYYSIRFYPYWDY